MYSKLLLNSKAAAFEKAQMNETAMLKSLQVEDTNRKLHLEQQRTPTATLFGQAPVVEAHEEEEGIGLGILVVGAIAAYFILIRR